MYSKVLMLHDNTTNDVIVVNTSYLVFAFVNEYSVTSLKMSNLADDENTIFVKEGIGKIYLQIDDNFICLHNSDDNTLCIFNIDKFIYSYYDATDKCGVVVMDIDDELYSFEVNETPHKIMKKIAEKKNEIKEK